MIDLIITNKNGEFWHICTLNSYLKKQLLKIKLIKWTKLSIRIDPHHQQFYIYLTCLSTAGILYLFVL